MTPVETLRHHAKTFFWAWLLLPAGARGVVAELYAFCRAIDDLADGGAADRGPKLDAWRARVAAGADEACARFEAAGIERRWILDLLDGAIGDVDFRQPADEAELDRYCYRVAGVVGLMMCPLLGVRDADARQHAVDLGSAMQLTNIARDIAEDERLGRRYVPAAWDFDRARVGDVTRRLLTKAEGLYESGARGLRYLPWRARISIAVARVTYRAIGSALARQDYDSYRGRAYVSFGRKVWLSLTELITPRRSRALDASHNLAWTESH